MHVADLALDFLWIFAALYVAHLVAYFGLGGLLVWWNDRHPERRIQKDRRGEDRARVEIVQSLKALVVIVALMAAGLALQKNGFSLFAPLDLTVWSFAGMMIVSVLAFDAWFYWAHRLMHWRPLYRFHRLHHKSLAPTVWSNYSDDAIDAAVHQGYLLIAPLILPIPPVVLLAHRLYDHVNGQIGHSGFEYFAQPTAKRPWPLVCTTFHDQHHELFNYNFGNFFSVWDRVMGTLHPSYDHRVAEMSDGAEPHSSRSNRVSAAE
jgi:sterol desaturase/sphingolipid hydroxylase (fatty acid hydroxylase superfamily)